MPSEEYLEINPNRSDIESGAAPAQYENTVPATDALLDKTTENVPVSSSSRESMLQKIRHNKFVKVGAFLVAAGIAGHFYVGYEAHRFANILQDSGGPTGRDAGAEAAKVFVGRVSDPRVQNQFFSNVIDNYNALPPNQRINFMQGLLAIVAESSSSTPKPDKKDLSAKKSSQEKHSGLIAQATPPNRP